MSFIRLNALLVLAIFTVFQSQTVKSAARQNESLLYIDRIEVPSEVEVRTKGEDGDCFTLKFAGKNRNKNFLSLSYYACPQNTDFEKCFYIDLLLVQQSSDLLRVHATIYTLRHESEEPFFLECKNVINVTYSSSNLIAEILSTEFQKVLLEQKSEQKVKIMGTRMLPEFPVCVNFNTVFVRKLTGDGARVLTYVMESNSPATQATGLDKCFVGMPVYLLDTQNPRKKAVVISFFMKRMSKFRGSSVFKYAQSSLYLGEITIEGASEKEMVESLATISTRAALKLFKYEKARCPACKEEIYDGAGSICDQISVLQCDHVFHEKCFNPGRSKNCPACYKPTFGQLGSIKGFLAKNFVVL